MRTCCCRKRIRRNVKKRLPKLGEHSVHLQIRLKIGISQISNVKKRKDKQKKKQKRDGLTTSKRLEQISCISVKSKTVRKPKNQ